MFFFFSPFVDFFFLSFFLICFCKNNEWPARADLEERVEGGAERRNKRKEVFFHFLSLFVFL